MNTNQFVDLSLNDMQYINGGVAGTITILGVVIAKATIAKAASWGVTSGVAIGIAYYSTK